MTEEASPSADRIVQELEVLVGKPVVKGTRISVELVLGHLAENPDLDELFVAYPRLTVEDIKAVLAHAHDAVVGQRGYAGRTAAPALPAPA